MNFCQPFDSRVAQGMLRTAAILALAAASLSAQTGQVGGPLLGFVYDSSTQALRPVLGIPGASSLGAPLSAGFALSSATVAPRQDAAIAFSTDGSVHLLRLDYGAVSEVRCAACPSTAETAIFSPAGSAVALYTAGHIQIVTGLPDTPAAGASFEVGSRLRGTRSRPMPPPIALTDDGAYLLASTSASVELFQANGGSRSLTATKPFALVAFSPGSHDAVIADSQAGLMWIHDVASASGPQQLSTVGISARPSALAFSPDGARVLVASLADQSVASIDVASGAATTATCDCAPSDLIAMGRMLRLNELGSGPLWLLDSTSTQPRFVFVPAVPAQ